jgi:hypothetical protein
MKKLQSFEYPPKFQRLLYVKLGQALQDVSDYCGQNDELDLAVFFDRSSGGDASLRVQIDAMMDVVQPSFLGKTEAQQMRLLAAQRKASKRASRS